MRRFWDEIQEHRLASCLFLAYWALAYVLHISRWHAPKDTADIIPPVLLLHALLPFFAGLLAAWWRGRHPGRILDGMLAGAVVTLADFLLLFLPDALNSHSPGGEGAMEIPAWLAVASLVGAVLGFIGAAAGVALGGTIPLAERGRTVALPRRILLIACALAIGVAATILVAVIPSVAADTSPGATPDRAVPALGIMAVLNVYAGAAFLIAKSPKTGRASRPIAAIAALLVIALGAVFAAAGSAGVAHSHMGVGAGALIISALGNGAAGILALIAVFRRAETVG